MPTVSTYRECTKRWPETKCHHRKHQALVPEDILLHAPKQKRKMCSEQNGQMSLPDAEGTLGYSIKRGISVHNTANFGESGFQKEHCTSKSFRIWNLATLPLGEKEEKNASLLKVSNAKQNARDNKRLFSMQILGTRATSPFSSYSALRTEMTNGSGIEKHSLY